MSFQSGELKSIGNSPELDGSIRPPGCNELPIGAEGDGGNAAIRANKRCTNYLTVLHSPNKNPAIPSRFVLPGSTVHLGGRFTSRLYSQRYHLSVIAKGTIG